VYVGSGPAAAARAMDKWLTKCDAEAVGLRTAPAEVWTAERMLAPTPAFGLPLVVKPVDQGSSVATFIVRREEEFRPAVRAVIERFGRALIEKFIAGREITVGIVGHRTLPPIWIQPKRAFYDYEAKYQDDSTDYRFDTGLSDAQAAQLQADSRKLFDRLGCRDLARVDWIVDDAGVAWMLEVNTLPGFTSHSLVPKAAAQVGLPFDALCETLAALAWERRR
jgi:D-alanine-D-alanine ligase